MAKIVTSIVGSTYRGSQASKMVARLKGGSTLTLQRDPLNKHDKYAVKVMLGDLHLGFLPREDAKVLSAVMDSGKKVLKCATSKDGDRCLDIEYEV